MGKLIPRGVAVAFAVGFMFVGVQLAVAAQSKDSTPVTVTNTPLPVTGTWAMAPPTMTVITLADGVVIPGGTGQMLDFESVDVSGYEWISFLGSAGYQNTVTIYFGFSADRSALESGVPAFMVGQCHIRTFLNIGSSGMMMSCYPNWGALSTDGVFRIAGPFLRLRATTSDGGTNTVTLKAVLRRR